MAPAKGNKHAVGHGRPPTPGFSDKDLLVLGKELLLWCKDQEDSGIEVVHLSEFYSVVKGIPLSQWKSICERECFLTYYEQAREWMGRQIIKSQKFATAYGSRFLGIYFRDLFDHERQQVEHKIDYEIKRKAATESSKSIPPNDTTFARDYALVTENVDLKKRIVDLQKKIDAFTQDE